MNYQAENLQKEFNATNKEIAALRKVGMAVNSTSAAVLRSVILIIQASSPSSDEIGLLSARSRAIKTAIAEAKALEESAREDRDIALLEIGNVLQDDVPVSNDEV